MAYHITTHTHTHTHTHRPVAYIHTQKMNMHLQWVGMGSTKGRDSFFNNFFYDTQKTYFFGGGGGGGGGGDDILYRLYYLGTRVWVRWGPSRK
jgi:hypothetical protein